MTITGFGDHLDFIALGRGGKRLGTGVVVVWFVFWTCAYVARSPSSENMPIVGSLPLMEYVVLAPLLLAAAIFGARWIISGFRSSEVRP
jgi:hypothetical protein